ncbi:hypothetical protein H5410_061145 [Solanum commersonii]|uniref:Uncharacterized protein n=1 Tax=Solanum commersonii TaxID=4109 RepID=A0A9J5W6W9_SOLCO|nr:hypothetical protein H5410_061145 [Solanum commersonii]
MKSTKRGIAECIVFWLARERSRKTKTSKLIADGIGLTKAEAVLKVTTQCSREIELIWGTKHGRHQAKRNKVAKRRKKRWPDDRLIHW